MWWWCALALAGMPSFGGARAPFDAPAESYRPAASLMRQIAAVAEERPGRVEVEALGKSRQGQTIWAVHIAEPGRPVSRSVLVFAGIHALEWVGVEAAAELIFELAEAPVEGVRVTVVPLLNPDGRTRVEHDLRQGENAYHRGNHLRVDLNRNFGVHRASTSVWRHLLPRYHGTGGAEALSEPETRALDALLARERYDRAASLHAFGGYLFYPYSGRWRRPEEHTGYVDLGRRMQAAQGAHAYRPRQLSRWGFFFRAQGTEIDHMHACYGTQSWLIEITRSGVDWFPPGRGWRTYFRRYNPARPERHVRKTLAALQVLVRQEP